MIKLIYNLGDGPREIEPDGKIDIGKYFPIVSLHADRYYIAHCAVKKEIVDNCGDSLDEMIQEICQDEGEVCGYKLAYETSYPGQEAYVYEVKIKCKGQV